MKNLLFAGLLLSFTALSSNAAINQKIEAGTYKAVNVGDHSKLGSVIVDAEFKVYNDGSLKFNMKAYEVQEIKDANNVVSLEPVLTFSIPDPGCQAVYKYENRTDAQTKVESTFFVAYAACPVDDFKFAKIEINIDTVNAASVRSEDGALVPVVIDVLGPDATMFYLKIVK